MEGTKKRGWRDGSVQQLRDTVPFQKFTSRCPYMASQPDSSFKGSRTCSLYDTCAYMHTPPMDRNSHIIKNRERL